MSRQTSAPPLSLYSATRPVPTRPRSAAKAPPFGARPRDRRRRAGVVLPIRRRLVLVAQELPQNQQRRFVVLRAFLPGRRGDVPRQMRGDDMAAAVAKRDVPAEVVPAALAFRLLDQVPLRFRKIGEQEGEAGEHRPRLEIRDPEPRPARRR